jgi:hypothetical protein
LIQNVILPHTDAAPDILFFNMFLFRAFNWWDTYEDIGWTGQWDYGEVCQILKERVEKKEKLTSGAYMMRGREGMPKGQSIAMTLDMMWRHHKQRMVDVIKIHNSIEAITREISDNKDLWGWSDFTAYQVALDLTYSPLMPNPVDLNSWCSFGPGAKRGLKLIWPEAPEKYYLSAAKSLLEEQEDFRESHVPVLTLQDIEFSLCELQKYSRIMDGGRSKERFNGKG